MKQISIDLCSSLLDKKPISQVKAGVNKEDLHAVILELLDQSDLETTQCSSIIQLCRVIRKTLDWTLTGQTIVTVFIQTVMFKAMEFDISIGNLQNMKSTIKPFEIEMLQEMAETLLVFPSTFSEDTLSTRLENHLYYMIGCGVNAL